MQETWLNMKDIVDYLGVTAETVRSWINNKGFPAIKVGGRWKFRLSEVDAWLKQSESPLKNHHNKYMSCKFQPTLIHDDCLHALKSLDDSSVDLVLTDPPYNLGLFMKNRDAGIARMRDNYFGAAGWDNLEYSQWAKCMDSMFEEAARLLKAGGAMIVFMAVIKVETIVELAQKHGFYYKTTGTWHKLNPMPRNMNLHFINSTESWIYFIYGGKTGTFNNNGKALHDFIETSITSKNERSWGKHPTQKPVALMEYFVKTLSNSGGVVLDPFMGSGSTGVASMNLNRRFIGIEVDDTYYEIACNRMEDCSEKAAGN